MALNIQLDFQIKRISLTLYLDEIDLKNIISRDENHKFIYFTIESIQFKFKQLSNLNYEGIFQIERLFADDFRENNSISRFINKNSNSQQKTPLIHINFNLKHHKKPFNRKGIIII